MRADQWLVGHGLAASRSQAARLIDAGARWQYRGEWKPLRKSDDLPDNATVELANAAEAKFVSRGGLKLQGALAASGLQVQGKLCLDIGQSTGGFSDCLLQHGAAHVLGVDVGYGQLHPRLRSDSRVTCVERVNARLLDTRWIHATLSIANYAMDTPANCQSDAQEMQCEVLVGDVSFISQTLLLPALAGCVAPGGAMLMLVKPQFELQPEQIGKGGIVKDPASYAVVQERICTAYQACSLQVNQYFESPIAGGDGNREFFIYAVKPQ